MNETRAAIVRCPDCGQKNRLRRRSSKGYYSCARCQSRMKYPFYRGLDIGELLTPGVQNIKAAVRLLLGFRPHWSAPRKSMIWDMWQGVSASVPGRVVLSIWGVAIWALIVRPLLEGRLEIDLFDILVVGWFPAGLLLRFLKTTGWVTTNGPPKSNNGQYRGAMWQRPPKNVHHSKN